MSYSLRLFVIFFIAVNWHLVQAQSFPKSIFGERPHGPDTLVYPFYNDVQMIEVDKVGAWKADVDWHESTQPRGLSWNMLIPGPSANVYVFRNRQGKVIKAYNAFESLDILTKKFQAISITNKAKWPFGREVSSHKLRNQYQRDRLSEFGNKFNGLYKVYSNPAVNVNPYTVEHESPSESQVNLVGLIDSLGNIRLPIEYSIIEPLANMLLVCKNKKCGVLTSQGQSVLAMEYDSYAEQASGDIAFIKAGVICKLYDAKKKKFSVIQDYDFIDNDWINNYRNDKRANEGVALFAVHKSGKIGLINNAYEEVIAPSYDFCEPRFRNGLARVCRNGKWGYINATGQEAIPCKYADAQEFVNGSAIVIADGAVQCINLKGEKCDSSHLAISPNWKSTFTNGGYGFFTNGLQIVTRNQYFGIIGENNQVIAPLIYSKIEGVKDYRFPTGYSQQYYKVTKFGKQGILNKDGREVLAIQYDEIGDFQGETSFATLGQNDKCGLINGNMQVVIPCKYTSLNAYSVKPHILFEENKLQGIMDTTGKVLLSPQFNGIGSMHDGFMRVTKNKKFGMIAISGKVLIPIQYENVGERFYNGLIEVTTKHKVGFMDSTATFVIPPIYDEVRRFEKNIAGVKQGKKFGFIALNGKQVVPFIYDFVDHVWAYDNLVKVRKDGKIGYLNTEGKEAIPCMYEDETGFMPERGHHLKLNNQWLWVKPN